MRKWWPLVAVSLGTFMLLVDVTIVNVALPDMARSLATSFSSLQWVVDAYALVLAALLLGVGGLVDRIGHRTGYLIGIALFGASSLVCGLSTGAGLLIAARAVQGIGGATMLATTFPLINNSYAGQDRGVAYGIWGAVAGASSAVGPVLGGLLTQGLSWNWIFFVNVPVSVLAIALVLRVLAADHAGGGRRVDVAGIVTFTVGAAALTFALIEAGSHGWGSARVLWSAGLAVVGFAAFLAVEARVDEPMVDLSLLRRRSFAGTLLAALALNFSAFAALAYASIWLQSILGLSPISAGLVTLPMALGAFVVSAVIGRFLHHRAPGPIIGAGMILIGAGSLIDALFVRADSGWAALMAGFAVTGIGTGLAIPTLSSSATAAVPRERGGMASGMLNTIRQLGFAIGIAVLGTVFASAATRSLRNAGVPSADSVGHAVAGGQAQGVLAAAGGRAATLDRSLHAAASTGLDWIFVLAGAVGVLTGVVVLILMRTSAVPAAPDTTRAPIPAST